MRRGTTPTLTFELPFDTSQITIVDIAFAQQNIVIIDKTIDDVEMEGNVIRCQLTESETLLLDCKKKIVEIQLRVGCGESRMASDIMTVCVDRILKEGCLNDDVSS